MSKRLLQTYAELACTSLQGLAQVDALTVGRHLLPHQRARHLRFTVNDRLQHHPLAQAPTPPTLDADTEQAGLDRCFQFRVCLAWYTAQGPLICRTCLPYDCALPPIFNCSVVLESARCQYQSRTHEVPCHHLLGRMAHHVHACGQGPHQHKNNRVRDAGVG